MVRGRGDAQPVNGFERDVQRRIHADGDIRAIEVVIDRGGHAHNRESGLRQNVSPFLRPIAPDYDDSFDTLPGQVAQSFPLSSFRGEFDASRGTEKCAGILHDPANITGIETQDISGDQPFVTHLNAVHLMAKV